MQKYSLRKLQTNSRTTFKAGTHCKFFTFPTFYDVKIICELNKKSLSLFSLRTAKFYTQKILLFANLNFCANSVSVHLSNSNFLHNYPRSIIRLMTIAEIVQHCKLSCTTVYILSRKSGCLWKNAIFLFSDCLCPSSCSEISAISCSRHTFHLYS